MPASQFFSVLKAGKRIKNTETQIMMAHLCDISAIAIANPRYHEIVKEGFVSAARMIATGQEPIRSKPTDAGSDSARDAMFAAIYAMKGGSRGG